MCATVSMSATLISAEHNTNTGTPTPYVTSQLRTPYQNGKKGVVSR